MTEFPVKYRPSKTAWKFQQSNAFVRFIKGPVGSGKSVACVIECLRMALEQPPGHDGIIRSRGAIIRNSYPELRDTTRATFDAWMPEGGEWSESEYTYRVKRGNLDLEILFRALDRPKDIRKLLSLELSWAWLNEARELPRAVLDMLLARVGRYPSVAQGGNNGGRIILDSNSYETDHWLYRLFEEKRPADWVLFNQPGARHADAENLENLPPKYYQRLIDANNQDWIKVFVDNEYGFAFDGKPIFPEYADHTHCREFALNREEPLWIGFDWGLTPAACLMQRVGGQWRAYDEIVTEDMGAVEFGEIVAERLRQDFHGMTLELWGDPAGDIRAQTDKQTVFGVMEAAGLHVAPTYSNDFVLRREAAAAPMRRLVGGEPAFILHPRCKTLRKGLMGGYCYRRLQVAGEERYRDIPDKGRYSHVVDAMGYAMLAGGAGSTIATNRDDDGWDCGDDYNEAYAA